MVGLHIRSLRIVGLGTFGVELGWLIAGFLIRAAKLTGWIVLIPIIRVTPLSTFSGCNILRCGLPQGRLSALRSNALVHLARLGTHLLLLAIIPIGIAI